MDLVAASTKLPLGEEEEKEKENELPLLKKGKIVAGLSSKVPNVARPARSKP